MSSDRKETKDNKDSKDSKQETKDTKSPKNTIVFIATHSQAFKNKIEQKAKLINASIEEIKDLGNQKSNAIKRVLEKIDEQIKQKNPQNIVVVTDFNLGFSGSNVVVVPTLEAFLTQAYPNIKLTIAVTGSGGSVHENKDERKVTLTLPSSSEKISYEFDTYEEKNKEEAKAAIMLNKKFIEMIVWMKPKRSRSTDDLTLLPGNKKSARRGSESDASQYIKQDSNNSNLPPVTENPDEKNSPQKGPRRL